MQHEIETATSSHIQGETIYLEAMFIEHEEVEADPLMAFKRTFGPIHNVYVSRHERIWKGRIQKGIAKIMAL